AAPPRRRGAPSAPPPPPQRPLHEDRAVGLELASGLADQPHQPSLRGGEPVARLHRDRQTETPIEEGGDREGPDQPRGHVDLVGNAREDQYRPCDEREHPDERERSELVQTDVEREQADPREEQTEP